MLSVFGASADMTGILQLLDQHTHHFAYTCKIAVDTLHEARTLNLISVGLQVDSQHIWAAHDDKLDTRLGMGKKTLLQFTRILCCIQTNPPAFSTPWCTTASQIRKICMFSLPRLREGKFFRQCLQLQLVGDQVQVHVHL